MPVCPSPRVPLSVAPKMVAMVAKYDYEQLGNALPVQRRLCSAAMLCRFQHFDA
jgi:hypothetical protein